MHCSGSDWGDPIILFFSKQLRHNRIAVVNVGSGCPGRAPERRGCGDGDSRRHQAERCSWYDRSGQQLGYAPSLEALKAGLDGARAAELVGGSQTVQAIQSPDHHHSRGLGFPCALWTPFLPDPAHGARSSAPSPGSPHPPPPLPPGGPGRGRCPLAGGAVWPVAAALLARLRARRGSSGFARPPGVPLAAPAAAGPRRAAAMFTSTGSNGLCEYRPRRRRRPGGRGRGRAAARGVPASRRGGRTAPPPGDGTGRDGAALPAGRFPMAAS